jgi:dTMP kinase
LKQGFFITVEGGEGAGKTTLIHKLSQSLFQTGKKTELTREPGGIRIAEEIRRVILDTKNTGMDARTEALLYAAARRQHLVQKVIPALQSGKIVICDRFIDSSLAYQGYARGLGVEAVWEINRFAIDNVMPHLTLYMDVPPEVGLHRINTAKVREINRLDLEGLAFHHKVREGYLQLLDRYPERIVRIDADQEPQTVFEQVVAVVEERIKGFYATDVKFI